MFIHELSDEQQHRASNGIWATLSLGERWMTLNEVFHNCHNKYNALDSLDVLYLLRLLIKKDRATMRFNGEVEQFLAV